MQHRIGFIAGNFDVIHPGYVKMFKQCKEVCGYLIVALHDDPSAERKEKIKPVLSVEERTEILLELKSVDEIIPYQTEKDLLEMLQKVNPSVRFLGSDYKDRGFTGDNLNIPIHYNDRSHSWSTTKFKKMIALSLIEKI
jgi:glycerol-3-phosphate cytidylyltransferase